MIEAERPWRSVLYIPGSNARALEKARGLEADAIIFDLEDAVAPAEKDAARRLLADVLTEGGFGRRGQLVRINALSTEWGLADLDAIAQARPQAVLLPKVDGPGDVAALSEHLAARPGMEDTGIWAMMETPQGVLNAAVIARAPRMAGYVMGTNDLAKEVGCRYRRDRLPLMWALQSCLLAARAAGIPCIDGVYNAFKDDEGLTEECRQGRDLGMDGKTLIHPAQLDAANRIFAPTETEIELARRQIAAFEAAEREGKGVAVVDGRIVENLHIVTARATLAKARAIVEAEA